MQKTPWYFFLLAFLTELTLTSSQNQLSNVFHRELLYDKEKGQSQNMYFPYQQERLPKDVLPEKYHLWMKPNTDGKTDFCGEVTIELKCVHSTRYIILQSKDLNITNYRLFKQGSSQHVELLPIKTNMKNNQILFEPISSLLSGEKYELFIAFHGHMKDVDIKDHYTGLLKQSYIKKDGRKTNIVFSMLPLNATRTVLPCFDEPEFKSKFLVTIEHDGNLLKAVTNTPLVKKVSRGNGMVESIFEASVEMSSYHLMLAISDFANISKTTGRGTKITIWSREEALDEVESSLEIAATSLTSMEEYTGIDFPYSELSIFVVPRSSRAFEGFGLIILGENAAKQNDKKEEKSNEYFSRTFIPHEIAHIWFGGIFTIKYWDEFWLHQGLATFFQYTILEKYDNLYKPTSLHSNENVLFGLSKNSKERKLPMNSKRGIALNDFIKNYQVYYEKPASLFYMLEKLFGKKSFQQVIRRYLQKFKYANANATELWEVFQSLMPSSDVKIPFDVKTVMHEWEYQSGYPVINIKYVGKDNNGNKKYTATQSRYVDGLTPDDPKYKAKYSNYSWYVPLWYSDSSSPSKTNLIWMNKTSVNITVPGCAKWIKGNAGQVGFYRVMYEQNMWDNLTKQLNDYPKAFQDSDRNGLIMDSYEFWEDGTDFNITVFLKITTYLSKEKNMAPFRPAMEDLEKIISKIRFQPSILELFRKYLASLLKETMLSNVWEDPIFKRELFSDVFDVLAHVGEEAAIDKSLQIVNNWMKTKKYNGEFYIRQSVYELAARYGSDDKHWEFLYQQYKDIANVNETTDINKEQRNERKKLLAGLSATNSTEKIYKWLNDTYLESVSNKTDIWEKLEQVSRYNPGRDLAWIYFKTNFDTVLERDVKVNGNKTASFLEFTKYFDEQCQLEDVETFARSQQKLWSLKATNTSLEAIRTNIKWLKRNEQHIKDFLTKQVA